jgi:hypothetical protein
MSRGDPGNATRVFLAAYLWMKANRGRTGGVALEGKRNPDENDGRKAENYQAREHFEETFDGCRNHWPAFPDN